ncbi:nucleoside 2-deoxyribosyltransferase domain-containing protein [Pendulispora brunnea]|uniref:Nucleoside 2-deoxyribosyltransferase domain-containing protein n=1 Tax=Pendulispora brunnea TaxID=2905690 RepID=A0ABZ2K658_9BACT
MSLLLKPPAPLSFDRTLPSVFLAGSIEMGQADDWQRQLEIGLEDTPAVVLNPRRDDWDPSWKQSMSDPNLRAQVEWELDAQDAATCIAMYFAPTTKAPITLLELGLFARTGKVIVCCPDGFWRKGNVDIVCARYGIPTVSSLGELLAGVRHALRLG